MDDRLKTILQENQFIIPSYQLYGGATGFQDYGILGTVVKNKFLAMWRDTFITDSVFEIETPNIVPYNILKASGHVDRFTDYVVTDANGVVHRADHLAKKWLRDNGFSNVAEKVDTWTKDALEANINNYKMMGSDIKVHAKNLMFEIQSDFLRPELAQSIFVNYKSVQKDIPFGLAQIGRAYRKEIAPKPYTRMREFNQAEIEYFVDPLNKTHPNFSDIEKTIIPILTQEMQMRNDYVPIQIATNNAVQNKLISHTLMAYYMAKVYLFALKIGLKPGQIRFRQHLSHEMAHYASECWDLETFVNGDWLECVGIADRGSYDLRAHDACNTAGTAIVAKRLLETPVENTVLEAKLNLKLVGQRYRDLVPKIKTYFENLTQGQLLDLQQTMFKDNNVLYICIDDVVCNLSRDMLSIVTNTYKILTEDYYPHVIEPSFGIDRLLYSVFYQCFWARPDDNQRIVLSLPDCLTPYHVAVFFLSKNDQLVEKTNQVIKLLCNHNIRVYTDTSSTNIGKKYVRSDEIGVKYAVTIDFDSIKDDTVTIRERDTKTQIRTHIDTIPTTLQCKT